MTNCAIRVPERNRVYEGSRSCDNKATIIASVSDLFTGTRFFSVHPDFDKVDRQADASDFTIPMCKTHRNALAVNITEAIEL